MDCSSLFELELAPLEKQLKRGKIARSNIQFSIDESKTEINRLEAEIAPLKAELLVTLAMKDAQSEIVEVESSAVHELRETLHDVGRQLHSFRVEDVCAQLHLLLNNVHKTQYSRDRESLGP